MRVLGPMFYEEQNTWPSLWKWPQAARWTVTDGGSRLLGQGFDTWREPASPTHTERHGEREIPIQYETRHGYQEPLDWHSDDVTSDDDTCECDEESDDQCSGCWNLDDQNNNGSRLRKRRRDSSVNVKLIASDDSLFKEVIEIDPEDKSKHRTSDKSSPAKKVCNDSDKHPTLPEPPAKTVKPRKTSTKQTRPHNATDHFEQDINETEGYSVYKYLKAELLSTDRQIDGIKGDGNCFFRALSKVIYGTQHFYDDIRQSVVQVMEKHPKSFEQFTDGPMRTHIRTMKEDRIWATQTEIYATATLLNRDVYILSPNQKGDTYRWLLFSPQFRYVSSIPSCPCYITLCHTHGNHYDRIAPFDGRCNCDLEPPEMSGFTGSVDLTGEDEIV